MVAQPAGHHRNAALLLTLERNLAPTHNLAIQIRIRHQVKTTGRVESRDHLLLKAGVFAKYSSQFYFHKK